MCHRTAETIVHQRTAKPEHYGACRLPQVLCSPRLDKRNNTSASSELLTPQIVQNGRIQMFQDSLKDLSKFLCKSQRTRDLDGHLDGYIPCRSKTLFRQVCHLKTISSMGDPGFHHIHPVRTCPDQGGRARRPHHGWGGPMISIITQTQTMNA